MRSINELSSPETAEQISTKIAINVHWMVLYQICADLKSNMAARVHNVFSLAEILKIFLSCQKPPSQLNCDCRNDHWVVLY
jgi:hypothetical protein